MLRSVEVQDPSFRKSTVIVRFARVGLDAFPMCHPQVIRSRMLMRHDAGNTLKSQDNHEGSRVLLLNPVECAIFGALEFANSIRPFLARQVIPAKTLLA
jgi:hypothetical protein